MDKPSHLPSASDQGAEYSYREPVAVLPGHGHAVQRVYDVGEEDAVQVGEESETLAEGLQKRAHQVHGVVHRQGDQQLGKKLKVSLKSLKIFWFKGKIEVALWSRKLEKECTKVYS